MDVLSYGRSFLSATVAIANCGPARAFLGWIQQEGFGLITWLSDFYIDRIQTISVRMRHDQMVWIRKLLWVSALWGESRQEEKETFRQTGGWRAFEQGNSRKKDWVAVHLHGPCLGHGGVEATFQLQKDAPARLSVFPSPLSCFKRLEPVFPVGESFFPRSVAFLIYFSS